MLNSAEMSNYERILAEARELLSEEEQRKLSLELVSVEGAFDSEIETAWLNEAKKRFEDLDQNRVEAIPWEVARKRLFGNR